MVSEGKWRPVNLMAITGTLEVVNFDEELNPDLRQNQKKAELFDHSAF
jgi:hypothetical protein